jgi:hypothetical protein
VFAVLVAHSRDTVHTAVALSVVLFKKKLTARGQGKEAGAKGKVAKLVGQVLRLLGVSRVTAVKAQAKLPLKRPQLQLVGAPRQGKTHSTA